MKSKILIGVVLLLLVIFIVNGCKKAEVGTQPTPKETKAPEEKIDVDPSKVPQGSEAEVLLNLFDAMQEELG